MAVKCPACDKRKFEKKNNKDGTFHWECRYCGYKTNRIYKDDDDNWNLLNVLNWRIKK